MSKDADALQKKNQSEEKQLLQQHSKAKKDLEKQLKVCCIVNYRESLNQLRPKRTTKPQRRKISKHNKK